MADENPQRLFRGFEKNRLEALIDGIFSVALTLLVLDIKLPERATFATNADLWQQLLLFERHFAIYVITFIVIGIYWIGHHLQFHYVRYTDRRLIWINMLFLLLISFLPFATDMVGDHAELILPCEIYGLTLLVLSFVSYIHVRYLTRHPHLASPDLTPVAAGLLKRRIALFTLIPVLSMALAFYSTRIALYVYVLLAAAHFIPGRIDEHIIAQPAVGYLSKDSESR
jgi:uncharacterized membrane protein